MRSSISSAVVRWSIALEPVGSAMSSSPDMPSRSVGRRPVDKRQPLADRLLRRTLTDLAAPASQLLERERLAEGRRHLQHDLLDVPALEPDDQIGLCTASTSSGVLRCVTRSAPNAARRVDGRRGGGHARDRLDAGGGHLDRERTLRRRATAGAPPSMGNGTGSRCRPRGCGGGPPLRRAYRGAAAQSPETRRSQRFWLPASGVM